MPNEPRVLVADDDPIARRFLESALSKAGYEVTAVSTGDAAWQILSSQEVPTIAVLDWMMPGLIGVELCEKVRAANLPVPPYLIVLTSRGETGDVVEALRAGADDHITKPFEIAGLSASRGRGADRHAPGAAHRESPLARGGAGPRAAAPEAHSHLRLVPPGAQRRELLGAGGQLPDQALGAAVHPRHLPHLPGPGSGAVPGLALDLAPPGGFPAPRDRATVRRVVDGRAGPTTVRAAARSGRHPIPVAENFVILFVIAALAGGFALVLFTTMWRVERRAHWGREEEIKRSQRLERRVFLIGVGLVIAMVAVVVTMQLSRASGCRGTVVMVAGSDGRPRECSCEQGRRGACFDPGP